MAQTMLARRNTFGGPQPLYPDRLASAVQRQYTSAGGVFKYSKVHEVGATLFYGLALNHGFENGNKRTALISLLVLLDMNRTVLVDADEDDLYELAKAVVTHELPLPPGERRSPDAEVQALARWIRSHSRREIAGDRKMYFSRLKKTLEGLGCTFDRPDSNYIKVRYQNRSMNIGYPRAEFEIAVNEVKRIRRVLQLDEAHGTVSTNFYDLERKVDDFVAEYRDLMRRLADL
jgi:death-on-curing protein